ncbi:MAG: hypothetical protein ACREU8_00885 [Gammaproteobacteria bacterium]
MTQVEAPIPARNQHRAMLVGMRIPRMGPARHGTIMGVQVSVQHPVVVAMEV